MNYRKEERRREKRAEWAAEKARMEDERRRKDSLSMYDRIEESDASAEVKDILHRLANGEREK